MLEGALAQVALNHQHALATQLRRAAEGEGQQGLAFSRPGRGNGNDLRMVDIKRQTGPQCTDLFGEHGQRPAHHIVLNAQIAQCTLLHPRQQRKARNKRELTKLLAALQRVVH